MTGFRKITAVAAELRSVSSWRWDPDRKVYVAYIGPHEPCYKGRYSLNRSKGPNPAFDTQSCQLECGVCVFSCAKSDLKQQCKTKHPFLKTTYERYMVLRNEFVKLRMNSQKKCFIERCESGSKPSKLLANYKPCISSRQKFHVEIMLCKNGPVIVCWTIQYLFVNFCFHNPASGNVALWFLINYYRYRGTEILYLKNIIRVCLYIITNYVCPLLTTWIVNTEWLWWNSCSSLDDSCRTNCIGLRLNANETISSTVSGSKSLQTCQQKLDLYISVICSHTRNVLLFFIRSNFKPYSERS